MELLYSQYVILVFITVMALFFDVKVAIFLAAIVHIFTNISRLTLYRSEIKWEIIQQFGVVSIIGAFIGSYSQIYLDSDWLKVGIGLFLMIYALFSLVPNQIKVKLPNNVDILGGFLSGLIGGLIGN